MPILSRCLSCFPSWKNLTSRLLTCGAWAEFRFLMRSRRFRPASKFLCSRQSLLIRENSRTAGHMDAASQCGLMGVYMTVIGVRASSKVLFLDKMPQTIESSHMLLTIPLDSSPFHLASDSWACVHLPGKGTCIWSNGDIYEGEWEEGFANGLGIYSFAGT